MLARNNALSFSTCVISHVSEITPKPHYLARMWTDLESQVSYYQLSITLGDEYCLKTGVASLFDFFLLCVCTSKYEHEFFLDFTANI